MPDNNQPGQQGLQSGPANQQVEEHARQGVTGIEQPRQSGSQSGQSTGTATGTARQQSNDYTDKDDKQSDVGAT